MTVGKALVPTLALVCAGCDRLLDVSEEMAKTAVAEQLIDPASAQFRSLRVLSDSVCGEVNGKNKMGAFVGFRRFVVDRTTNEPLIDPQFDYTDLLSARDLCDDVRGNEYSSFSTTMSVCQRVTELEAAQLEQAAFDRGWGKGCGPATVKRVYRPPLGSQPAENLETVDQADLEVSASEVSPEGNLQSPNEAQEAATPEPEPGSSNLETSELVEPDV